MYPTDTPLDVDPAVVAFHDRMLAKGRTFYGVAVQPPKGKAAEVRGKLEVILRRFGYVPKVVSFNGHIAFEGEYSPESMEAVRNYLTNIERQTPSVPVMRRGDYFEMAAYKWLDGVVQREKFNGCRR